MATECASAGSDGNSPLSLAGFVAVLADRLIRITPPSPGGGGHGWPWLECEDTTKFCCRLTASSIGSEGAAIPSYNIFVVASCVASIAYLLSRLASPKHRLHIPVYSQMLMAACVTFTLLIILYTMGTPKPSLMMAYSIGFIMSYILQWTLQIGIIFWLYTGTKTGSTVTGPFGRAAALSVLFGTLWIVAALNDCWICGAIFTEVFLVLFHLAVVCSSYFAFPLPKPRPAARRWSMFNALAHTGFGLAYSMPFLMPGSQAGACIKLASCGYYYIGYAVSLYGTLYMDSKWWRHQDGLLYAAAPMPSPAPSSPSSLSRSFPNGQQRAGKLARPTPQTPYRPPRGGYNGVPSPSLSRSSSTPLSLPPSQHPLHGSGGNGAPRARPNAAFMPYSGSNGSGDDSVLRSSADQPSNQFSPSLSAASSTPQYQGSHNAGVIAAVQASSVQPVDKRLATALSLLLSQPNISHIQYGSLTMLAMIGSGQYGDVYKAETALGKTVAVKKFKLINRGPGRDAYGELLREFIQEAQLQCQLRHPSILPFVGISVAPPALCIITEFQARGSLFDVLHRKRIKHGTGGRNSGNEAGVHTETGNGFMIPMSIKLKILRDVAAGMHFLHSCRPVIIHRDLKSHNILLGDDWSAKVCDFGISRLKGKTTVMTQIGTPQWMAPEVLREERYSEKADLYAFGVVLWELLTQNQPFPHVSQLRVITMVAYDGTRLEIPHWCPPVFRRMMNACWMSNPQDRPTFGEILQVLNNLDAASLSGNSQPSSSSGSVARGDDSSPTTGPSGSASGSITGSGSESRTGGAVAEDEGDDLTHEEEPLEERTVATPSAESLWMSSSANGASHPVLHGPEGESVGSSSVLSRSGPGSVGPSTAPGSPSVADVDPSAPRSIAPTSPVFRASPSQYVSAAVTASPPEAPIAIVADRPLSPQSEQSQSGTAPSKDLPPPSNH